MIETGALRSQSRINCWIATTHSPFTMKEKQGITIHRSACTCTWMFTRSSPLLGSACNTILRLPCKYLAASTGAINAWLIWACYKSHTSNKHHRDLTCISNMNSRTNRVGWFNKDTKLSNSTSKNVNSCVERWYLFFKIDSKPFKAKILDCT